MSNVTRLGDVCSGHDTHEPRASVSGSSSVFVNGVPIHRLGDSWEVHGNHDGTLVTASKTVFSDGLGVARIGDSIDCGSTVASGSNNVFAGD